MKRLLKIGIVTIIGIILVFLLSNFPYIYFLTQLFSFTVIIRLLFSKKPVGNILAWILLFALQPMVGLMLYYLIGKNYRQIASFRRKEKNNRLFDKYQWNQKADISRLGILNDYERNTYNNIKRLGMQPIHDYTNTDVLFNGNEKFPKLYAALKSAKHHIHLEYYIFKDGEVAKKIVSILIDKAREGVKVRILCDYMGSADLSDDTINLMKKSGIQFAYYGKVFFTLLNDGINYRNHRKIAIIDAKIGFLGGLNIGDEYLNGGDFGYWRDTHLLVEGEAIHSLQLVFAKDWYHVTGEDFIATDDNYLNVSSYIGENEGHVQIIHDGPNDNKALTKDLYFKLITCAKDYIYISTPYLIPDSDLLTALCTAAKTGIDVRILTPSVADHPIVFSTTKYYYQQLLENGIKIYQYQKGFMHSKFLIVDDLVAAIGSTNLDLRSFHINFELTAFVYKSSTATILKDFFLNDDLVNSKEVILADWNNRSIWEKTKQAVANLFTPLL